MDVVELDKALQPQVLQQLNGIGLSSFINFKNACNYELEFLKNVDVERSLYYNAEYLEISIRRYEHYWLPLLASLTPETEASPGEGMNMKYAPPMDIHWIWHVHMLAPVSYSADCKVRYTFLQHYISRL